MVSCSYIIRGRNFAINHNGPAIKGGCVTRRKHRAGNRVTLARKLPRCAPREQGEQRGCKPAWLRQSDREGMAHFLQPPFCKKCDNLSRFSGKQLTFIVRVIFRQSLERIYLKLYFLDLIVYKRDLNVF